MASETLHTLAMARALEMLAAEPKRWKGKPAAELAAAALSSVRSDVEMKQELEQAIDAAIVAGRGGV